MTTLGPPKGVASAESRKSLLARCIATVSTGRTYLCLPVGRRRPCRHAYRSIGLAPTKRAADLDGVVHQQIDAPQRSNVALALALVVEGAGVAGVPSNQKSWSPGGGDDLALSQVGAQRKAVVLWARTLHPALTARQLAGGCALPNLSA
jgi:hypothetical protein